MKETREEAEGRAQQRANEEQTKIYLRQLPYNHFVTTSYDQGDTIASFDPQ